MYNLLREQRCLNIENYPGYQVYSHETDFNRKMHFKRHGSGNWVPKDQNGGNLGVLSYKLINMYQKWLHKYSSRHKHCSVEPPTFKTSCSLSENTHIRNYKNNKMNETASLIFLCLYVYVLINYINHNAFPDHLWWRRLINSGIKGSSYPSHCNIIFCLDKNDKIDFVIKVLKWIINLWIWAY